MRHGAGLARQWKASRILDIWLLFHTSVSHRSHAELRPQVHHSHRPSRLWFQGMAAFWEFSCKNQQRDSFMQPTTDYIFLCSGGSPSKGRCDAPSIWLPVKKSHIEHWNWPEEDKFTPHLSVTVTPLTKLFSLRGFRLLTFLPTPDPDNHGRCPWTPWKLRLQSSVIGSSRRVCFHRNSGGSRGLFKSALK